MSGFNAALPRLQIQRVAFNAIFIGKLRTYCVLGT